MSHDTVLWLVAWIPVLVINNMIVIWLHERRRKRRARKHDTQFIKKVQAYYPGHTVTFIAVESSDKEAMAKIERQLRDATEGEDAGPAWGPDPTEPWAFPSRVVLEDEDRRREEQDG